MTASATGADARRERGKMPAAASDQVSNDADAPVPPPRFVAYPPVPSVKPFRASGALSVMICAMGLWAQPLLGEDLQTTPANPIQQKAARHWAFQPIDQPEPPQVRDASWSGSPIDRFILAKLETKDLRPSPPTDRRTLIRRAYYDLIGLPPTEEDVDRFQADNSPDAYARLVERLLGSYHYGERWGRYWLDVARYADTKGYVFTSERLFPYSYTYRDYVIRAFNEDLPYDQFLVEQIAADLLPLGEDKRPLAALGFLTLGRRFLNNIHDIIDDRIDVVTRGTMGLTVSCARCHDHKFDPIPTRDYYSLYGVFANTTEPDEKPLLGSASLPPKHGEYLAERKRREERLENTRNEKLNEVRHHLRREIGDYFVAAHDAAQIKDSEKRETLIRERKLNMEVAGRWIDFLQGTNLPVVFGPWRTLSSPGALTADKVQGLLNDSEAPIHPALRRLLAEQPPATLKELAARYNTLFASADDAWLKLLKQQEESGTAAPARFEDPDQEILRQVLYGDDSPLHLDEDQLARLFDIPTSEKLRALKREIENLEATHPGAPPRAMALEDRPNPSNPHVFLRGNPSNRGPEAPLQFLTLLAGIHKGPFTNGSGRLELARAIASPENPLTARVIVNRVWMHHFGQPLVGTPSDFGLRAEPPSHPELLDYLAAQFMKDNWSIKGLHRLIMLSSAYQQSSQFNSAAASVDPDNQLLWRMNRRRLDFEATRDTLLAASGQLDPTSFGRSVDITAEPFPRRRTVYAFIERQNLPGLFRTFDFASPDTTCPRRFATSVPQQALFFMNSPFAIEQARRFVQRSEMKGASTDAERVRALYQLAYQRDPSADETAWSMAFLKQQDQRLQLDAAEDSDGQLSQSGGRLTPLEELAQVLLISNELFFID